VRDGDDGSALREQPADGDGARLRRKHVPIGADGADGRVHHAAQRGKAALREKRGAVREDAHADATDVALALDLKGK